MLHVHFHADSKHEQYDADLAEQSQRFHRRGRKKESHYDRIKQAYDRGTENNARDHLAHHRGLPQPTEQSAEPARDHEDDDDLSQ